MIRSMTGYGRAQLEDDTEQLIVEVKSVNYKYRKIYLHMSEQLSGLEPKINEILKGEVSRGRIDYSLRIKSDDDQDVKVRANKKAVKEYIDSLQKLQDEFGLTGEIDINLLTQFSDVLSVEEVEKDIEELWPKVKEVTKKALGNLMEMRSKEGEQLFSDFIHRLERIEHLISKVETRVPEIVEEYQSKLENRVNDLLNNVEIEEDRLASEVAIIADKSNVTEEIVRVKSHLEQFRETLGEDIAEPVGRKLDFIAQEMHREINTIGSKVSDSETSNYIIDLKSEVDKIREQVQNIE
ncbi:MULTISPECIES: YicC/YloC family endoribonuclease [unclassified Candidatus Frackibacter]|uniref:YicC/YloC family endoribonuclease n=1 Tax=unclassified Candidatus Frackibacter TaxID=2648818 RepID=UPI00079C188F|nr:MULTISPECIES: YicC/YloC family endoribonuclease [unclassified Candidatus Frackibacter]KXS43334.1 MAG: YicC domain-containing protein [Candidatus Frackibacter sp. T328-2]SDC57984.1 TIGR00255 family protein [Candidatus Frackibacter sp. WG11]SEM72082.1 TIGR00255 family protein [Candidatus Frackibacter sp. WG12]SFL82179.1 TIGR00255 family protein [Candidatus Frackibacter sp. WG13]